MDKLTVASDIATTFKAIIFVPYVRSEIKQTGYNDKCMGLEFISWPSKGIRETTCTSLSELCLTLYIHAI